MPEIAAEKMGKKKLERRVQKGRIHISPADKGKGLAAMPLEMYERMGNPHTTNDVEVTWEYIEKVQSEVKGHLQCLNKIFNVGEAHGSDAQKRAQKAKEVCNLVIPQMYMLAKDHKSIGEDGLPKCRPVCGATNSLNQEMSEWVSVILEAAIQTKD